MLVIPASFGMEIVKIIVQGQPRQNKKKLMRPLLNK
jgi:hypothetical protein